MNDDTLIEPGIRVELLAEVERLAVCRARATGRPVIMCGFVRGDRLSVRDVSREHGELVAVPIADVPVDRAELVAKVGRTVRRVLDVARRRRPLPGL